MQRLVRRDEHSVEFYETDEEVERRIERQKDLGIYGLDSAEEFHETAWELRKRFDARVAAVNLFYEDVQVYVGLSADEPSVLDQIREMKSRMDKFLGWCTDTMTRPVAYPLGNVLDAPRMEPGPLTGKPVFAGSYIGSPIIDYDGTAIGTCCVVRMAQTKWTRDDVAEINSVRDGVLQGIYRRRGLVLPA